MLPPLSTSAPGATRLKHPFVHPIDLAVTDQRADVGGLKQGIVHPQAFCGVCQPFRHITGNTVVTEHALNRYTHLAGMIETALAQQRDRCIDIGISVHNHRRGTAVFQCTARARRQFRAQHPADPAAAYETEKGHSRVGHQLRGQLDVIDDQCLAPVLGQAGLVQQLHKAITGQRCILRRFHDHRIAGSYAPVQPGARSG